ncbi:MAG: CPBP family intramembrane metalloprotease [Defluviitaleaceae bacterium]|nr:CPBP family intramembrane metalloprotease [Defluviitaleaceae bacterium]
MNKPTLAATANLFMLFLLAFNVFLAIILSQLGVYQLFPWSLVISQFFGLLLPFIVFRIIVPQVPAIPKNRPKIYQIIVIAAFSLLIQPALMAVSALGSLIMPNPVIGLVSDLTTINFAVALLVVAVVPSICEELVFRGFIQAAYKYHYAAIAAFINGLFFGFIHLNLHQFTYAFVMGIVFFYIVHITKSVFLVMLSHFVINATQFTLAYTNIIEFGNIFNILRVVAFTLPLAVILFRWLIQKVEQEEKQQEKRQEKNIINENEQFAELALDDNHDKILQYSDKTEQIYKNEDDGKSNPFNLPFFAVVLLYIAIITVLMYG